MGVDVASPTERESDKWTGSRVACPKQEMVISELLKFCRCVSTAYQGGPQDVLQL